MKKTLFLLSLLFLIGCGYRVSHHFNKPGYIVVSQYSNLEVKWNCPYSRFTILMKLDNYKRMTNTKSKSARLYELAMSLTNEKLQNELIVESTRSDLGRDGWMSMNERYSIKMTNSYLRKYPVGSVLSYEKISRRKNER